MINLSIIVPAYNSEKDIDRCLESIVNQKNSEIEIIVVNDGSTDKTLEKCRKFQEKYQNLKIITQKNHGVSYSRNIGIDNATGKYIMFVDADDYLEENSLNNIEEILTENIDILRFSYIIKEKNRDKENIFDNKFFDLNLEKGKFVEKFLKETNQNIVWGQAIRKELLKDIRFNDDIIYGEDLLFNCQLYNKCKNFKYTSRILYNYNQNIYSITRNYKNSKVKNKIDNLMYVFNEIIKLYADKKLTKIIENKFIGEIVPQIMMLTFDNNINKNEVLQQMYEVLDNDIMKKVFKDINEKELTMCKYKKIYKTMKNKNIQKLYSYSGIYKRLKMIQQFMKFR